MDEDPSVGMLDKFKNLFSQKASSGETGLVGARQRLMGKKLPFQSYMPFILAGLAGLIMADATIWTVRPMLVPQSPSAVPKLPPKPDHSLASLRADYNLITERNIFNADGIIPENMIAEEGKEFDENLATESQLPITLLGTIVHVNPAKSIATLEVKSQTAGPSSFIPNDDIEGMATLMKVERKRIIIRNSATSRYEFIQIKDETAGIKLTKSKEPTAKGGVPGIKSEGESNFAVQRNSLEGLMNNLPELLTQARAVPHLGPDGQADGFQIVEIQEDGIFPKLGIRRGDIIKGVDGEPVNSPARAMELYNALRTRNNVTINIDRGGQRLTLNYNIR